MDIKVEQYAKMVQSCDPHQNQQESEKLIRPVEFAALEKKNYTRQHAQNKADRKQNKGTFSSDAEGFKHIGNDFSIWLNLPFSVIAGKFKQMRFGKGYTIECC